MGSHHTLEFLDAPSDNWSSIVTAANGDSYWLLECAMRWIHAHVISTALKQYVGTRATFISQPNPRGE